MESHLSAWTLFSRYPWLARHGHYITDVNMNYIKAALALISAPLYLAYDDEPARNSSVRPE